MSSASLQAIADVYRKFVNGGQPQVTCLVVVLVGTKWKQFK